MSKTMDFEHDRGIRGKDFLVGGGESSYLAYSAKTFTSIIKLIPQKQLVSSKADKKYV